MDGSSFSMPMIEPEGIWSPDLFTQGLIPHTFTEFLSRYLWSHILKQDLNLFNPNYSDDPCPRWTLPVAGNSWDAPTLDYRVIIDDTHGPIMPMDLWQPQFPAGREYHVFNRPLCFPIYFYRDGASEIGISLLDAAEKRCRSLSHWFDSADFGGRATTWVKILAKGYPEFAKQMQTKDETRARCPLKREKVAQRTGRIVRQWISEAAGQPMYAGSDSRWRIGPCGITESDIILLGIVNVSAGTWMPLLRLNRSLPSITAPAQSAPLFQTNGF